MTRRLASWLRRIADRIDTPPMDAAIAFTRSATIQDALDVLYMHGWRWQRGNKSGPVAP